MKIFSTLKKKYKRDKKRIIWRILFNGDNYMLLEERDPEKKEVFFSIVDVHEFKTVMNDVEQGEQFWTGVESFYGDYIIFHGFAKPDMPFHKGVRLYSISRKKILWQYDELLFSFIENGKIWVYKPGYDNKTYMKIDPESGMIEDTPEPEVTNISAAKAGFREFTTKGIIAPEPDSADPDEKRSLVYPERAENELYIFRSGYKETLTGSYDQILYIIRKSDPNHIDELLINENTKLIIPDSWFLRDDVLFVIRDKVVLNLYKLEE